MKEKKLYLLAIIGAVICFVGDNLLGHYLPANDFGSKLLCIKFSYEWADVNPAVFVAAGICGVVSLLMMFAGFYGIYLRMKKGNSTISKLFLLAAFIFVAVGILYHNVFSIAAYIYNKLTACGFADAKQFTMDVFHTFIAVSSMAALGYAIMVVLMFVSGLKGQLYPRKWMCVINPLIIMLACIVLSNVLPQTAFVNGFFGLGQQSVGLFIVFVTMYFTSSK